MQCATLRYIRGTTSSLITGICSRRRVAVTPAGPGVGACGKWRGRAQLRGGGGGEACGSWERPSREQALEPSRA